jgi:hypothetical protein
MNIKNRRFKAMDIGKESPDLSGISNDKAVFPESEPVGIIHSIDEHNRSNITIVLEGHYGLSYGTITMEQLNQALREIGFDIGKRKPATMEDLTIDLDDVRILSFKQSLTEQMWYLSRKQIAESLLDKYNIYFKDHDDRQTKD